MTFSASISLYKGVVDSHSKHPLNSSSELTMLLKSTTLLLSAAAIINALTAYGHPLAPAPASAQCQTQVNGPCFVQNIMQDCCKGLVCIVDQQNNNGFCVAAPVAGL